MITRKKSKYVIVMILLITWAGGLLGYMKIERFIEGKNLTASSSLIHPLVGTTYDVSVPVLLYHGLVEEDDGVNVTVSAFREQMLALRESGYTPIDTHDLYAYYKEDGKMPEKPIAITFDDGRRDSYLYSDPILEEVGFKAVMFVVTERVISQNEFFLSWDELGEMQASGRWDIEAHAYKSHDPIQIDAWGKVGCFGSNKMWIPERNGLETDEEYRNRLLDELRSLKNQLETNIEGVKPIAFAYPLGDFGQMSNNIDRKKAIEIYTGAVKSVFPLAFELNHLYADFNNYRYSDCGLLKRLEVGSDVSATDLLHKLSDTGVKELPYVVREFNLDEMHNWFWKWGNVYIADNSLSLASLEGESGAMTTLYGGYYWTDYSVFTQISAEEGYGYVAGRYMDEENYVLCGIEEGELIVREKVEGQFLTIASLGLEGDRGEYELELKFNGDTVTCMLDDQHVLGPVALHPSLDRGGVGFQAWNPENGIAKISLRKLAVIPNQQGMIRGFKADFQARADDIAPIRNQAINNKQETKTLSERN